MDSSLSFEHEEEVVSENTCETCGKHFSTRSNLKRHTTVHSDNTYRCDHCQKEFTNKFYLNRHLNQHKTRPDFLCPHCAKHYATRQGLDSHIKFKHNEAGKSCDICQKTFKDNYAVMRHMKSHDNTKEMCPRCYGLFKDMQNHVKLCKIPKPKRFSCELCNTCFTEKKNLSRHIQQRHEKPKLHICDCGKAYKDVCNLKRHLKSCEHPSETQAGE